MSRPARAWDGWDDDEDLEQALDDGLRVAVGGPFAAQPAPYAPPARKEAPAPRPAPRRRVRWGQLATVSLVGYLVAMGAWSEIGYLHVAHQSTVLARQAAVIAAQNQSLKKDIGLLHQRRYVDELARTELGYTSPGEVELVPKTKR